MPEILIRPRAHSDLKAIWDIRSNKWGERQVDLYLKQLDDGIQSPREFRTSARPATTAAQVSGSYRSIDTRSSTAAATSGSRSFGCFTKPWISGDTSELASRRRGESVKSTRSI
jgi:plasmid stabilization system protein ParE